jgi:2'-5' RNA ligase
MAEQIRAFIAVDTPDDLKRDIGQLVAELKKFTYVKWVSDEALHITLKFLGNVTLETADKIRQIIAEIPKDLFGFNLKIESIGAFPNLDSARVFWLGATSGADRLEKIYNHIEEHLIGLDIKQEERRFSPHLTIGRMKKDFNYRHEAHSLRELVSELEKYRAKIWGEFAIEKIYLFKSTLKPT